MHIDAYICRYECISVQGCDSEDESKLNFVPFRVHTGIHTSLVEVSRQTVKLSCCYIVFLFVFFFDWRRRCDRQFFLLLYITAVCWSCSYKFSKVLPFVVAAIHYTYICMCMYYSDSQIGASLAGVHAIFLHPFHCQWHLTACNTHIYSA